MRYRGYGDLDDPPLLDGDEGFSGFVTRVQKSNLAPGELSQAYNVRLDKSTIRSRKTAENLTNTSRNTLLKNNGVMDAIAFNDGVSEGDQVLFAGTERGYLTSTEKDGDFEVVDYPTRVWAN